MSPTDRPILVVDDDADVREAVRDTLQDEGYPVAEASDGTEALRYLRAHSPPPLILLDWNMAPMNGGEFMAELGKDARFSKAAVVLLTADAHIEDKVRSYAFADCLRKPVSLDKLFQLVARFYHGQQDRP